MAGLTENEKRMLDVTRLSWLGRVVGGGDLYNTAKTGLQALGADGKPVDVAALVDAVQSNHAKAADPNEVRPEGWEETLRLAREFGIPSIADDAREFDEKTEARERKLDELRKLIELEKEEIRNSTDYEVLVKRRMEIMGHEFLYGSKSVATKTKAGGVRGINRTYDSMADKEYDSAHYEGRVIPGPSEEQTKAMKLVIDQLELLTRQLQNNDEYAFTPPELMAELWTPLVREGLISEDQCPAEFSRVTRLFQGASELYNLRMEAQTRLGPDQLKGVRGHLDDFVEVLGIGAAATDLVLSMVGGQGQVQQILALAVKITQGGVKTASAMMERKANLKGAADNLAGVIGDAVAAGVGGEQGTMIGALAKSGFKGCANVGLFAKKLAERDYESGFQLLASAVGDSVDCVTTATGNSELSSLGRYVTTSLNSALRGGKVAYLLSQEPVDTELVKKELQEIVSGVVTDGLHAAVQQGVHAPQFQEKQKEADAIEDKESAEYKAALEELGKLKKQQGDQIAGLDKAFASLFEGGKLIKGMDQRIEELAVERGADGAMQEIIEENDAFNKRLGIAFGMSIGADDEDAAILEDLYSIDVLIAQIERDRAALQMFNMIFDAAGAVITMVVPQLGGVLKAKAFAMNVVAAAQRSHDLIQFTSLVDDARKATSPQAATLLAEVDELKRHLTNDTLEAAIALGQAVGLTVAAAGDIATAAEGAGAAASMAGRGFSAALDVFKKSKDLLKRKFEEKKTAKAWDMYVKALKNPADRRHVLKTFRKNTTLAKYGIAYGAIEMDDPIARETLRQLGINDAVLAQEASSADKIVMFLEAKFADDIVVEGIVSQFAPDRGEPLTLAVWVKNREAAASSENLEDGRWKVESTNGIDAALIRVEQLAKETSRVRLDPDLPIDQWGSNLKKWNDYVAALRQYRAELERFRPLNVKNQPFKRFQQYIQELAGVAERKIQKADEQIQTQMSLRDAQLKLLKSTGENAAACVREIENSVRTFGSPQGRPPEELIELFGTGPVNKLLQSVRACSSESPNLLPHANSLQHAVEFALRKIARAMEISERDQAKAAGMTEMAFRDFEREVELARKAFGEESKRAEERVEQLLKLAS